MSPAPSEYPRTILSNPPEEVYKTDCKPHVEQSAIYLNVHFAFLDEESPGIVLTSQCDMMEHSLQNYVLLARIVPVAQIFYYWLLHVNKYTEEEISGSVPVAQERTKRKGVINDFRKRYLGGDVYGYYFLPRLADKLENSFVCFETTQCLSLENLSSLEKICVLHSPFREAVPTKFAAYMGRIGTSAYPKDYFQSLMDEICKLRDP